MRIIKKKSIDGEGCWMRVSRWFWVLGEVRYLTKNIGYVITIGGRDYGRRENFDEACDVLLEAMDIIEIRS